MGPPVGALVRGGLGLLLVARHARLLLDPPVVPARMDNLPPAARPPDRRVGDAPQVLPTVEERDEFVHAEPHRPGGAASRTAARRAPAGPGRPGACSGGADEGDRRSAGYASPGVEAGWPPEGPGGDRLRRSAGSSLLVLESTSGVFISERRMWPTAGSGTVSDVDTPPAVRGGFCLLEALLQCRTRGGRLNPPRILAVPPAGDPRDPPDGLSGDVASFALRHRKGARDVLLEGLVAQRLDALRAAPSPYQP